MSESPSARAARATRAHLSQFSDEDLAYHESGHAVVGWAVAQGHEVHRISIVARGQSHGYTLSVPMEDRLLLTRASPSRTRPPPRCAAARQSCAA